MVKLWRFQSITAVIDLSSLMLASVMVAVPDRSWQCWQLAVFGIRVQ